MDNQWINSICLPEILLGLFEFSSDIVFLIKGDRFLFVNPKGETYLGLSNQDLVNKPIHSFLSASLVEALSTLQDRDVGSSFSLKDEFGRSLMISLFFSPSDADSLYLLLAKEVTSQQQISRAFQDSKKNYQEIVESMEDGYYEVDLKGNFTYLNQAICRILGFTQEEGLGMNYRQFYKDPEKVFQAYNKVYRTGEPDKGFGWTIVTRGGQERFVEVSIALLKDERGNPTGFSGVARDISERKKTEQTLWDLSTKDTLTGLYNRYFFEEELKRLKELDSGAVTIFAFDIDGLKFINDTLGHSMGDTLLKLASQVIHSSFRTNDLVARIGGDEFAAILPTYSTGLIRRIERTLKQKITRHNRSSPHLPISLSIGVAGTQGKEMHLDDVLRQADDEMYRKKEKNKMRVKLMILDHFLYSLEKKDFVQKGHRDRVRAISLAVARHMGFPPAQLPRSGYSCGTRFHPL